MNGGAPRLLITGATGFTGQHACKHFSDQGFQVEALIRQATHLPHGNARVCDLMDRTAVTSLLNQLKPDYILHLASINAVPDSWNHPLDCMYVNVFGTLHLLEAARLLPSPPKVLVVGSMLAAEPEEKPSHPYALSKGLQRIVTSSWGHLFELPILLAEPVNLIGPGPSRGVCTLLARSISAWEAGFIREPFRLSSLTERRDFLDVRDAVRAYEAILLYGTPGERYRFGSGYPRSMQEMLDAFVRVLCHNKFPLEIEGKPPRNPDPPILPLHKMQQLGWGPAIPFEQSVSDILAYTRSEIRGQMP